MKHNDLRLMSTAVDNCQVFVNCREIKGFKTITVNGLGSLKFKIDATNEEVMKGLWDIFKVRSDVGDYFSL